eukprot:358031-Chlamydomonas_euryale.AAC.12
MWRGRVDWVTGELPTAPGTEAGLSRAWGGIGRVGGVGGLEAGLEGWRVGGVGGASGAVRGGRGRRDRKRGAGLRVTSMLPRQLRGLWSCDAWRTRHGCRAGPQRPKKARNRASHKADAAVQLDRQRWLDAQIEEGEARLRAGNMRA